MEYITVSGKGCKLYWDWFWQQYLYLILVKDIIDASYTENFIERDIFIFLNIITFLTEILKIYYNLNFSCVKFLLVFLCSEKNYAFLQPNNFINYNLQSRSKTWFTLILKPSIHSSIYFIHSSTFSKYNLIPNHPLIS